MSPYRWRWQVQQVSDDRGHDRGLEPTQELVPPRAQMAAIGLVERRGRRCPCQVFCEAIGPVPTPFRVVRRQLGDAESLANTAEIGIETLLGSCSEGATEQRGCALRVVDQHVQH